ncbi:MAG: HypC/HybG/HupF family hydrogenase formation chaperone [Anaerolineaceae bacterium]|nr:HypC/HybG/HupF family hydrogenase formation chaperone [Anaerolineaceae bacterium]
MCLGIPGKIIELYDANGILMSKVDFGGVIREVCIQTLPEAKVGDYTIVHAGFALNLLSEKEAKETIEILKEIDFLNDEIEQINKL